MTVLFIFLAGLTLFGILEEIVCGIRFAHVHKTRKPIERYLPFYDRRDS